MNKRSSQSSQLGLFSEQISEQIGRLRALAGGEAERTGVVATKRAVMATRLLAGSARVLHVEKLPAFLDEMLLWLQKIESSGRPSTPTQAMILDGVIAFEEGLMLHLEESPGEGLDLSGFEEEIEELRGLIRENQRRMSSGAEPPIPSAEQRRPDSTARVTPVQPVAPAQPVVPPPPVAPAPPEPEIPAADDAPSRYVIPPSDEAPTEYEIPATNEAPPVYEIPVADEASAAVPPVENSVARAIGTIADYLATLQPGDVDRLRGDPELMRQLERLQGTTGLVMGSTPSPPDSSVPSPEPTPLEEEPTVMSSSVTSIPASDDPLACSLAEILHVLVQRFPGRLEARVEGVGGDLVPGMGERAESIVQQLLEDAFEILLQMFHEDDAPEVARLEVKLDRHDRRLRLSVRDNGPSLRDSPALEHADPLGLYRGLRRARSTIEELRGLITVEPSDRPGTRFVLSLPLDATRPLVRVIDLGRAKAALPGLLTEEYLSTEGLLFHRDTDGEHFKLHGQPIPLVDLANYVPGLDPLAEDAPGIAIVGSVEKRIGIYCYGLGAGQESPYFEEAVKGWHTVSGKKVEVEGKHIPLLSVARLLELRMQMPALDEPGSMQDPMLDAYVPSDDEVTVAILPTELPEKPAYEPAPLMTDLPSGKMTWQALLVNQSEFRRRELARILEERGYHVMVVDDLQAGLDYLDQHLVHLLVTDLRLGDKGAKGLTEFRSKHPELPVVLTSSVAREYAEELARRTGVSACWLEPYHATDLDRILSGRG